VTLSSSKAKYVAISEVVKEIKFIYYLLREIGIEFKLPITVVEKSSIFRTDPEAYDNKSRNT
jgi:hypothetical protein